MNAIDKAIGFLSPQAGLRRARARLALTSVEKFAYEGAKVGRHTDGWITPGTSANAEVGVALAQLRSRSRDLYRNNPLAKKAVSEIVTKTVGTGIIPQSRAASSATRKKLDALFEMWSNQADADGRLNYFGLQGLGVKTIIESGECLTRYRLRRPSDGFTVPFQLQLCEPDYLDHSKTEQLKTGYIIQGVQFDMLGRREGYWLFSAHPGDVVNTGWFKNQGFTSAFVPEDGVGHGYEVERAGQVRGVPRCAPVIIAMRDLDEYEEALRVRKKIEACFAAFVHQGDGDTSPLGIPSTADASGNRVETFEPGMIEYLANGKDVTFADPKSNGAEPEYIRMQERKIAAGWLIPYEILTGDLSQINYSSYRGGLLGFRDMIEGFRWNTVIPWICEPVWKRFVDACVIAGFIPEADYAVEWGTPKFDLLDREKEADADRAMLRIGTMTWPQAVAAQGYDPQKQLTEVAEWNSQFDESGVVFDSDPRKTTPAGKVVLPNETTPAR